MFLTANEAGFTAWAQSKGMQASQLTEYWTKMEEDWRSKFTELCPQTNSATCTEPCCNKEQFMQAKQNSEAADHAAMMTLHYTWGGIWCQKDTPASCLDINIWDKDK